MTANRRSFLQHAMCALGLVAIPNTVSSVARMTASRWVPSALRVSTPALRATWPQVLRLTLGNARALVARGVVGAGLSAAAALKALQKATGRFWYDPVFKPSLRNLRDGSVR